VADLQQKVNSHSGHLSTTDRVQVRKSPPAKELTTVTRQKQNDESYCTLSFNRFVSSAAE